MKRERRERRERWTLLEELYLMRRARPGREGFWRVHVPDCPDAIGELQPLPYTSSVPGESYAMQCFVKGRKTCSRCKTVKFEVDGHEVLESYLCNWVVHGFYDPGVRNKEHHMKLAREHLGPWIDWG